MCHIRHFALSLFSHQINLGLFLLQTPFSDSVVLVQSSPSSKAVTIRQASFASFSVESASYFRCDVTAITPPDRWTDDVITFFFRFADEENEEKLTNLREKMKEFYANDKYNAKVSQDTDGKRDLFLLNFFLKRL